MSAHRRATCTTCAVPARVVSGACGIQVTCPAGHHVRVGGRDLRRAAVWLITAPRPHGDRAPLTADEQTRVDLARCLHRVELAIALDAAGVHRGAG